MTPYNHLRSQHCNASWRGQFMYNAQLAPHTTFNIYSGCVPARAVGPHAWRLSQGFIRKLATFQVRLILDKIRFGSHIRKLLHVWSVY